MFSEKENVLLAGPHIQPGTGRVAGLGKLAPKTPNPATGPIATKTPFRVKIIGVENQPVTSKKSIFQQEALKFATPVGPRRVPLGGKTTNARARLSSGKGKLQLKEAKLASPRLEIKNNDDEYPEPEYMPPRAIDLPDLPDDYEAPNFELMKEIVFAPGLYTAYLEEIDDEGKTKTQRRMEARVKACEEEMLAEAEDMMLPAEQQKFKAKPEKMIIHKNADTSGAKTKLPSSSRTISQASSRASSRPTSGMGTISRTKSRPTSSLKRQASTSSVKPTSSKRHLRAPRAASPKSSSITALTHRRSVSAVSAPIASRPLSRSATSTRPVTSTSSSRPVATRLGRTQANKTIKPENISAASGNRRMKNCTGGVKKVSATIDDEEEEILAEIRKIDIYKDEIDEKNWEEMERQQREKALEVLCEDEDDFQL